MPATCVLLLTTYLRFEKKLKKNKFAPYSEMTAPVFRKQPHICKSPVKLNTPISAIWPQ